jgi:hypothetical protein
MAGLNPDFSAIHACLLMANKKEVDAPDKRGMTAARWFDLSKTSFSSCGRRLWSLLARASRHQHQLGTEAIRG